MLKDKKILVEILESIPDNKYVGTLFNFLIDLNK